MKYKSMIMIGTMITLATGFGGASSALQEEDRKKNKLLPDPMTRAELQCAKLKAEAANGTEDDKKAAEQKCAQAIEWAKEMMKKEGKKKPDPTPES